MGLSKALHTFQLTLLHGYFSLQPLARRTLTSMAYIRESFMTKEQFYQGMKSISMFILFSLKLNSMSNLNFSIIDGGNLSNCLIHQCTPLTNYRMRNSPCIVSYPYSSFYGCLGNSRIYFINFSIQNIQILHFCYTVTPLKW